MHIEESEANSNRFESPAAMSEEDFRRLLEIFQPVGKSKEELDAYKKWIEGNRALVKEAEIQISHDLDTDPLCETQTAFLHVLHQQLQQAVDENSFAKTPLLEKFLSDSGLWH